MGIDSEGMQRFVDSLASTRGGPGLAGWYQPAHFALDYRIINRNLVELGDSEE